MTAEPGKATSLKEQLSNTSTITQDSTLLEVNPTTEVLFPRPQASENVTQLVLLKNTSSSCVAFKFKTNNIEAYRVKPPLGILKPGAHIEVLVQLLAGHTCLPMDKLLVVSMKVENDELNLEEVARQWGTTPKEEQHNYKIRCKLQGGNKEPKTDMKPDALRRFQGDMEQVHQKISNLMLSNDSLKFHQRLLQLVIILLIIMLVALTWLSCNTAWVIRHEPAGGLCDHHGSLLTALICS